MSSVCRRSDGGNKMKRNTMLIIAALILWALCLTGCGKSEAVTATEQAISAIGEVTVNSGDAIANAEKMYNILTDSEKEKVSNRLELVEAKDAFEKLQGELAYDKAKKTYEKLNTVASVCTSGMDDIYAAWRFGIYDAGSISDADTIYEALAEETPHLSTSEIEEAAEFYAEILGIESKGSERSLASLMKSDWEYTINLVEIAFTMQSVYDIVDNELSNVQTLLRELTEVNDSVYYPELKEYYMAASSYAAFFKSVTGSFGKLSDTIKEYEKNIQNCQTSLDAMF